VQIMKPINQNPRELIEALKQGLPITCGVDGKWLVEGKLMQLVRRCFGAEEGRLLALTHALIKELDLLEQVPVKFEQENTKIALQDKDFRSYLEAGQMIVKMLKKNGSSQSLSWSSCLDRKLIALQYRLENVNGGLDPVKINEELSAQLKPMAVAWKNEQPIFSDKGLTREEISILAETTTYIPFAELILTDSNLRSIYFEWILKDKNTVAPFVQYPHLHSKIIDSSLNGRIGRLGGGHLQVTKMLTNLGQYDKALTLLMEGKPISLLDEEKIVVFKGNYKLSIKEIFSLFKNKLYKVGNLEFLEDGINNWNAHHLGYWDADKQIHNKIDLKQPLWWEQLPVFERLSRKQAARRYGMLMDGVQWVAAARATRGTPTLDYDKTHAFMELAIPQKEGSYIVYDFGKFAYQFPSSFFNSLLTFCLNMHATIAYPDENVFYSERQHGCYPFLMSCEQGQKLMELIKEDIFKSREYNLVFQIESENCAKWLYEKLTAIFGDNVPNLFKMSLMKTEPVGFVGACFNLFRKLGIPEQIQFKLLTLVHIPFGAGTGTRVLENGKMVIKALNNHEFWQTSEVYLPAFLIAQMEIGTLQLTSPLPSIEMEKRPAIWSNLIESFKEIKGLKIFKGQTAAHDLPSLRPPSRNYPPIRA
jgi:hypothetical protein